MSDINTLLEIETCCHQLTKKDFDKRSRNNFIHRKKKANIYSS